MWVQVPSRAPNIDGNRRTWIRVDNMPQHIGNEESRARRRALKSHLEHQNRSYWKILKSKKFEEEEILRRKFTLNVNDREEFLMTKKFADFQNLFAQVVELVDTTVLEAVASRCKSSSLFLGTIQKSNSLYEEFFYCDKNQLINLHWEIILFFKVFYVRWKSKFLDIYFSKKLNRIECWFLILQMWKCLHLLISSIEYCKFF